MRRIKQTGGTHFSRFISIVLTWDVSRNICVIDLSAMLCSQCLCQNTWEQAQCWVFSSVHVLHWLPLKLYNGCTWCNASVTGGCQSCARSQLCVLWKEEEGVSLWCRKERGWTWALLCMFGEYLKRQVRSWQKAEQSMCLCWQQSQGGFDIFWGFTTLVRLDNKNLKMFEILGLCT